MMLCIGKDGASEFLKRHETVKQSEDVTSEPKLLIEIPSFDHNAQATR